MSGEIPHVPDLFGGHLYALKAFGPKELSEHRGIVLVGFRSARGQRLNLQGRGDLDIVAPSLDDVLNVHAEASCLHDDEGISQWFYLVQELVHVRGV